MDIFLPTLLKSIIEKYEQNRRRFIRIFKKMVDLRESANITKEIKENI